MLRKTDSSGSLDVLLPGSWNPVRSRLEEFEYSGKFPIPTVDIPDSIQQSDFGAPRRVSPKANRNIKKYLMASQEFCALA